MVKPLELAAIQSLASATPYGGDRTLTSNSAALLISAASLLYDMSLWQGASYTLTDAEIDDIKEMLALAVDELLEEGDPPVSDFVNLAEVVHTSDVAYLLLDDLDFTHYHRAKVIVSGMLSDSSTTWVDHANLQINGNTGNDDYVSNGSLVYGTTPWYFQYTGGYPAILLPYAITSGPPSSGVFGNCEIDIYNPLNSEVKHVRGNGMVGGDTASEHGFWECAGVCIDTDEITSIKLFPVAGTTFLVDPAASGEPDELRMTVYGLK